MAARGSDVELVMVDGQIKVKDYRLLNVDVPYLLRKWEERPKTFVRILRTPVLDPETEHNILSIGDEK